MNPSFALRFASWLAVLAWAATIVTLSSLPGPQIEELNQLEVWDKAAHFLAFAVGGTLVALALRWSTQWRWPQIVLTAFVFVSLFGAADEFHQLYTPKRSGADFHDWLADTFGGLAGAFVFRLLYARYLRKNRPAPAGA